MKSSDQPDQPDQPDQQQADAAQRVGWLRAWLAAVRPATLWAAVVPVVVGTALAVAHQGAHAGAALAAAAGAVMIQVGTNLYNDYADFKRGADTPERLGPARATQRGWLTARQVLAGAALAATVATACGLYLVDRAGWPLVVIGVASLLAGWAYTGGPWPLGYHGLGEIFVFLFFGVVAVCGSYYVQALTLAPVVVVCSLTVGALASAILVVNNLRDRDTDAKAGKRTLAVVGGARFARVEYAVLVLAAYAGVVWLWWSSDPAHAPGWLLPLVSLPWAVGCVRGVAKSDGVALNALLGATARLETLFGALLAAGVLL